MQDVVCKDNVISQVAFVSLILPERLFLERTIKMPIEYVISTILVYCTVKTLECAEGEHFENHLFASCIVVWKYIDVDSEVLIVELIQCWLISAGLCVLDMYLSLLFESSAMGRAVTVITKSQNQSIAAISIVSIIAANKCLVVREKCGMQIK